MSRISIITVCYNSAATLPTALASVAEQTWGEVEHIVVDGGSSDGTQALLEAAPRVARWVSEPDRGIYDAINKGIGLATGEVVGILNSDDLYEDPGVLEWVMEAFRARPEADMVSGHAVFVEPTDLHRITRFYSVRPWAAWQLRFGWMPPHPATFVRRRVYERFGDYKLGYDISADYEFFVRTLFNGGCRLHKVDRVAVRMRTGGVSNRDWRARLHLNREIVKACRDNGVYTNLPLVLAKMPLKALEFLRRPERQRA